LRLPKVITDMDAEIDVADVRADIGIVDVLARLQLVARRDGRRLVLRNAPSELLDLLDFMGLADALPAANRSS
jgi:ABC-type transporter Mla MlaB component